MNLSIGQVVVSTAGHDKGDLLVIAGFDEKRVLLCDGKSRKLESPKSKNPDHIRPTETVLDGDSMATNRKIRKMLNKLITQEG